MVRGRRDFGEVRGEQTPDRWESGIYCSISVVYTPFDEQRL